MQSDSKTTSHKTVSETPEWMRPKLRHVEISVDKDSPIDHALDQKKPTPDTQAENASVVSQEVVPKPPSVELRGETHAEAIPESRTEGDQELGLPSVKNLLAKFSQPAKDDDPSGDSPGVRRVR